MRRLFRIGSVSLLTLLFFWASFQGASGQDPKEEAKKARLKSFYRVCQAYELSNAKPAKKVDDLSEELGKEKIKEFKEWLNFDELGMSLTEDKEVLKKQLMVYEKDALKDGGLVMFYDGSVKTLTAVELKKLVGKKDK